MAFTVLFPSISIYNRKKKLHKCSVIIDALLYKRLNPLIFIYIVEQSDKDQIYL